MPAKIDASGLRERNFPVVCVGGSAGGLDAYIRLLQNLPADLGVAVVIVNHITAMPPQLHEVLPRFTGMPVKLITDHLSIEPNHVYIIPANRDLHVDGGFFELAPISKPRGWPDVITVFLRSLTTHWEGQLIAVIVSGYDGDGADALCGTGHRTGDHGDLAKGFHVLRAFACDEVSSTRTLTPPWDSAMQLDKLRLKPPSGD